MHVQRILWISTFSRSSSLYIGQWFTEHSTSMSIIELELFHLSCTQTNTKTNMNTKTQFRTMNLSQMSITQ